MHAFSWVTLLRLLMFSWGQTGTPLVQSKTLSPLINSQGNNATYPDGLECLQFFDFYPCTLINDSYLTNFKEANCHQQYISKKYEELFSKTR